MWEKRLDDITRRREFRDLLPFYVNGTLDESGKAFIEEYLKTNPGANEEYLFAKKMTEAARLHGEGRDPMAGYATLKARLDASRPPPLTLVQRWHRRLGAWGLSPALAAMLVLASAQLLLTGTLLLPAREQAVTRGLAAPQQKAQIKLVLKRGANFGDVLALLAQQRCHIVWGPGAGGELWLVLDEPRDAARVRDALAASPLVEDVLALTPP